MALDSRATSLTRLFTFTSRRCKGQTNFTTKKRTRKTFLTSDDVRWKVTKNKGSMCRCEITTTTTCESWRFLAPLVRRKERKKLKWKSPCKFWWHSRQNGVFADDEEKQINENSNNVLEGIARRRRCHLLPFSLSPVCLFFIRFPQKGREKSFPFSFFHFK